MKKRFNALDIFICLCVCAAALLATAYFNGGAAAPVMASDSRTLYFTVEVISLPVGFSEKIAVGDMISDSAKGYYYGTVSDISVEPTMLNHLDAENQRVMQAAAPERETLRLTVKCDCTETDTEISVGGQTVKIGKRMTLKGKGYAMGGYVVEMKTE